MTIQLPKELEGSVRAEVLSGHFASADDAVAEIVREYFRQGKQRQQPARSIAGGAGTDPVLGSMRDAAERGFMAAESAHGFERQ